MSWPLRLVPSARWSLVCLSGLLNGLAFVWWGPAALIANVPLLVALRGAPNAAAAALSGGLVGFIAGLHIYGILHYGWLLWAGFALYTGSQMIVYALILRPCWGRAGPWLDLSLPATVWALTEWLRTLGPLAMPASYVGCLADQGWAAPWLALVPHTGGLGVSTLVALVQSAVFHLIAGERAHRGPALAALGLVAAAGGLGALYPPDLGTRPVKVAGVQGGLANPQYAAARADPMAMRDVVQTYATLSAQAYASDAELVVWPETAVRAPVLERPELRARLFPPADSGATLIAGLLHEDHEGRTYNLAAVVEPGGATTDHYEKFRLVPNAEAHLTPGAGWRPVRSPHGILGVLICLESVYPDGARALAAAGAEMLLVLSNDAGFGRSPITHHMTNRAVVRALETGRWLLRVGQAGITTLIDPRGGAHGRLGLFEPKVLYGEARLRADQTLYVRWGDWWMGLMGALLALSLARAWRRRGSPPIGG